MPKDRTLTATDVQRFWSRVARTDSENACWPWTSAIDKDGYGQFKAGANHRTHRLAWKLAFCSPIPAGMCIAHLCDNPGCCNPFHLFVCSHADNMADRDAKGRQANGENQHSAKLTTDQVAEIRASTATQNVLAKRFGIDRGTVSKIVLRKTWKHVP